MNVNFASNTPPGAQLPQEPVYDHVSQQQQPPQPRGPLLVADTAHDRRVIIIYEGVLELKPTVYKADSLYQAFLMFNQKLLLCECFDDAVLLQHCVMHLIYAWSTALKVMFIHEDQFLNQWEASQVEVAQATAQWLDMFTEINNSSPKRKETPTKMPSDGLAAVAAAATVGTASSFSPLVTPNHNNYKNNKSVVIMTYNTVNNSKRRYSSSNKPKAAGGDAPKRKATASKVKLVGGNKTPRKPSVSKKSQAAAAAAAPEKLSMHKDDQLLVLNNPVVVDGTATNPVVVDGTATGLPVVTTTEYDGTPTTATTTTMDSWEPLDPNDYDSQECDGIPSEYLECLLPEYSTLASGDHGVGGVGGDDSNPTVLSSFPPAPAADAHHHSAQDEEEDAASTTMADLLPCGYYSDLEEGGMTDSLLERPCYATEEDVDAFMNSQMPPLVMTSEDSSGNSADQLLNMYY